MTQEHNWKAILIGAVPVSLVMIFIFYSNILRNLKFFLLILGATVAIGVTYSMDKKKHNIFTAPFIVVIIALIVYGLRNLGFI